MSDRESSLCHTLCDNAPGQKMPRKVYEVSTGYRRTAWFDPQNVLRWTRKGWAAIRSAGNSDRSCCGYRLTRNLDPYNLFRSASLSAQEPRGPRQPGFLSGVNATPVNMRTFGAPASEAASREITNERTNRIPDRVRRPVKSFTPLSSLLMRCLLWHVYTL